MPTSAKLVLAALMLLLLLTAVSAVSHLANVNQSASRDIIPFVLQLALLGGLYTRQPVAWHCGRWLSGLAILLGAVTLLVALLATPPSAGARLAFIATAAVNLLIALLFFFLLGREDARSYFLAMRKV